MFFYKVISFRHKIYRYFKERKVYRYFKEKTLEFRYLLRRYQRSLLSREKSRIKLVAIAKNEACYIPEWIAHHLHFGFENIAIYINNTSDNSWNIKEKLEENQNVEFCDGDQFFVPSVDTPQIEVYRFELERSRRQGYTHVMFLDIDEFWTPLNLTTTINEYVQNNRSDVCSFQWFNRTNENEPFLPSIEPHIEGLKGTHVKSLVSTHLQVDHINPHSVMAYKAIHQLSDGEILDVDISNFGKLNRKQINAPVREVIVLHRMYRSQEEYVALLLRGRPINNRPKVANFKTNRRGYVSSAPKTKVKFAEEQVSEYRQFMDSFISRYGLIEEVELGQEFVMSRRLQVKDAIMSASQDNLVLLKKIFQGVKLEDVSEALKRLENSDSVVD